MSGIFISHSSKDIGIAVEIQDWLVAQGHEPAFLDYDPENGIPAGRNWEKELYAQLRACRVILVLWSTNWRASKWCFAELTHARAQGKDIIPITIETLPVDELVLRDTQAIDWNADRNHASARLSRALVTAGLDQQAEFAWDSRRSPYPGMVPFELNDAGVFFGRDQAIQEGLDRLSQLQRFGPRLLLLLGASGTGKSSLVRAGLVPRLRRDRQGWLVLDPIRPVPDPWHQLALAIHERARLFQPTHDWRALRDALQPAQNTALETARVLTDVFADLMVGSDQRQSTVFLAIDQAEELFTAIPPEAAASFLDVLRYVLSSETPAVVAVAAIRSDLASLIQDHPAVREIRLETMVLGSLSRQGYAQMIEGPARRAGLQVEPALVQAMLQDAHTSAAMPLLAFSLRELWDRLDLEGTLTLAQYQDLGGLTGAIAGFAERVIAAHALSSQQEIAIRAAFLTLVSVDEEAKFRRRPAHWDELPADAHPLLERFITARLLVSFPGDHGERVVEVAHEALFTVWPLLAGWLEQYRVELKTREDVERASREWHARGHDPSYLVHRGRRFNEASALEGNRYVQVRKSESEYLEACRVRQQSAAEDSIGELAEAGWGVILPQDTDEGVLTALQPLLLHRKSQANLLRPDGYREFIRTSGYRPGETGAQFLWRHGVAPGVSDRRLVPHYLLLVGDPETVPFDFQYQLSTTNAVGRLHFETHAEYAAYARAVVEAESGRRKLPRRVMVFAPANAHDKSMMLTVREFADPLARSIAGSRTDWSVQTRLGQSATKAELKALLGGAQTPAVLYLVAHGLTYPKDDPRQLDAQGALLCSDWKGGAVASESTFAAADVSSDASMTGMIGFLIGEYTGGTPQFSERVSVPLSLGLDDKPIAPRAFVAPLFRRLLGHPGGGALALVGHVERTWVGGYSGGKGGHEVRLFARVIDRLLQGEPLGAAMRPLFQRFADTPRLSLESSRVFSAAGPTPPTRRRACSGNSMTPAITSSSVILLFGCVPKSGQRRSQRIDQGQRLGLGDPAVRFSV